MTEDQAKAEAAKREKNKSKHLRHKRWEAVYSEEKGWQVNLVDTPQHRYQTGMTAARDIFLNNGPMADFMKASEQVLMARCDLTIETYKQRYGDLNDADMIAAIRSNQEK